MLLLPNRKKAVTLIIGSMGRNDAHGTKNGVYMPEGKEETDYDMALEDAGRKCFDAIAQNDVGKFVSYLKELVYMLKDEGNSEGEMEY